MLLQEIFVHVLAVTKQTSTPAQEEAQLEAGSNSLLEWLLTFREGLIEKQVRNRAVAT